MLFNSVSDCAESLKVITFVVFLLLVFEYCKSALTEKNEKTSALRQSPATSVSRAQPRRLTRICGQHKGRVPLLTAL